MAYIKYQPLYPPISRYFNYYSLSSFLPSFRYSFTALQPFLLFSLSLFPAISLLVYIHLILSAPPSSYRSRPSLLSPSLLLSSFRTSSFLFSFLHFVPVRVSPSISLFDYIHFRLFLSSTLPLSLSFNSSFLSYYFLPPLYNNMNNN